MNLGYTALGSCKDTSPDCHHYANSCQRMFNNSLTFEQACPFTCGKCKRTPITCSKNPSVCLNGGQCTDVMVSVNQPFGFTCKCTAGYSGQFCQFGKFS